MRLRIETVQTVYLDMPVEEAEAILEALNQHLAGRDPADFDQDDLIHPVFEFQERLARLLGKKYRG